MAGNMLLNVDDKNIAWMQMNDKKGKNIFSHQFVTDFMKTLEELENNYKPHVLVLYGMEDVFCGGAEKQTLLDLCEGKFGVKDMVLSERLVNAEYPVISAMEGHAMGGGLVLALCSDIVIAARESRYGAVFMSMGFTPGMGASTLLQDLFGHFIANEMLFTAKRFRGSELERKNTNINYILPRKEVMGKARDIALQISEKNIKSLYLLKYALSERKKNLLTKARIQEDMMHRLSFGFPETKKTIEELYAE